MSFLRYSTCNYSVTLKSDLSYGSLEVIRTDSDRSDTYDFLLTFHSNHGPILYRLGEKRRFQWKIAKFSHPVYFSTQLKRFP